MIMKNDQGGLGDPPIDQWQTAHIPVWPPAQAYPVIHAPRTMPVNVPFSNFGVTIVVMDSDGNITIKVDQPEPAK